MSGKKAGPRKNIRAIALPVEHGSWGMLFEPFVAAAAVYPSLPAAFILPLILGAFLLRRPVKVFLATTGNKAAAERRSAAIRFIVVYSLLGIVGLIGAFLLASPYSLAPLAVLLPAGAFQIYNDATGRTRALIPEVVGAAAISSVAASVALAGNAQLNAALAVWALFALRAVPSILYIRQRLRLEKGKSHSAIVPFITHLIALAAVAGLAFERLVPYLTLPVIAFLLIRSVTGLSERRKKMRAMQIGVREVIYGAALAVSYIAGSYLGI